MPDQPKLVIVDTNCYVRLYYSDLRPILGSVVSGHRLVTLSELANEVREGTAVVERNPWLSASDIQQDIRGAVLEVAAAKRAEYLELAKEFLEIGDQVLQSYCYGKGIIVRELSLADAIAIAIATDLDAVLATDEWPLRLVAGSVEMDDGKRTQLFSSLDLLQLLESEQKISPDDRIAIVKGWVRAGEHLLGSWREDYKRLFGGTPPTAQ
jgi:hypothetical protein